ncbi:MAG TPA: hypothetical protein DCE41_27575 [Cytophagales bacterium]|nr:hypothetical protein [Cytophagales bacterium]HAA21004.1 hypothetical protein [Cytophagales bacterium]HAP61536.1 hypothetical protein [Cytophagales bacterium]
MIVHWIAQLVVITLTFWLGGRFLKGVTFQTVGLAVGAALYLGIISLISEPGYFVILENFPTYTWSLFFVVWDTLWLLLLSRFVSGIRFSPWYWALILAGISAVVQTLFWILFPIP